MGKIAFVFAGQGSQTVGMGKDLYDCCDGVKELFDMAEEKRPGTLALMFEGQKEKLDITLNTQPALFLTDLACALALDEKGVRAEGVAGFSLGEVPAVCYAGLLEAQSAFDFVCHRAAAMHECALRGKGCMYAVVKLESEVVEAICGEVGEAFPVNYNCPGQTVVACGTDVAENLEKLVAERGGRAIKLAVSGAFHSPFMDAASVSIEEYLEGESFCAATLPVYSNATAAVYDDEPKILLAKQVNNPVLWQKTIENMIFDGFDTFIELGPGKTLSGLIKKINSDVRVLNISDVATLENTLKEL